MAEEFRLKELTEYYRNQGAPNDQQMLLALLKEAQDLEGGVLRMATISDICQIYGIKETVLKALIRRVPAIRCEDVPHKLELCSTCRCNADIRRYIEDELGLKNGEVCRTFGFYYRTVGCMKNCKNGPSIKYDGVLYSHVTPGLLKELFLKN